MRKPVYRNGDYRIITRFLWSPQTLYVGKRCERREQRWLEKATWYEEFVEGVLGMNGF
jgi:REP element-mobilizing transposase RayT